MYDIIIRGGSLVDGTGAEPVLGDLAIKNGLIAAMGQVDGEAREVVFSITVKANSSQGISSFENNLTSKLSGPASYLPCRRSP